MQLVFLTLLHAGASGVILVKETIPDNTVLELGQTFTPTWTVKNEAGLTLKYLSGSAGCTHTAVKALTVVPPNYTFAISCTAPKTAGTYKENWQLGSGKVWVQVKVISLGKLVLTSIRLPDPSSLKPNVSAGQSLKILSTVKDSQGAVISDVQIPVADQLIGKSRTITTGTDGAVSYEVVVPVLKDGSYTVTFGQASKTGYVNSSTTRFTFTIAIYADRFQTLPSACQTGLIGAMPSANSEKSSETDFMLRLAALDRARAAETALKTATKGTDIDWQTLAAFGIEESQFRDIDQKGGNGKGVFQIDLGQNPGVTAKQARDFAFAASWAAKYLSHSKKVFADYLTGDDVTRAALDSYNAGVTGALRAVKAGKDPDSASSNGHYGTTAMELTKCFP